MLLLKQFRKKIFAQFLSDLRDCKLFTLVDSDYKFSEKFSKIQNLIIGELEDRCDLILDFELHHFGHNQFISELIFSSIEILLKHLEILMIASHGIPLTKFGKKFIDCFLFKFLESVQHNLTPQIIRGFLHFKVLDLLASQIQTIVECFPELGDSVNDISVAIKDFPILEQDILRKEIHRLSTKVWNLSKDTNQLIDIYVRLTCFLFALDQSAKFLFLNAELKNEIKNRSDCTHSLAKFIFNSSRDASDSTNIYKLFESQFKRQHNDYTEFNFSPKLPPSVTLHELQAAKRGQNNIISLLGSLYSSEDQFIHEFNSIFFKFLMKNALELNHKTLVELWDLVNQVKEEFNNENIVKSLTMLQDVQSSLNYSTFCAEKTKFVEFPIQIYIVSHNYWPIISKYQKTLPPIVGPLVRDFEGCFFAQNPLKLIRYLSNISIVDMEVTLGHYTRHFECDLLQYSLLELYSSKKRFALPTLCKKLEISETEVEMTCNFWIKKGVMKLETCEDIKFFTLNKTFEEQIEESQLLRDINPNAFELFDINFNLIKKQINSIDIEHISQLYSLYALDDSEKTLMSNFDYLRLFLSEKVSKTELMRKVKSKVDFEPENAAEEYLYCYNCEE